MKDGSVIPLGATTGMTDQEIAKGKRYRELKALCLDIQEEDGSVWDRHGDYGIGEWDFVMVDADVWEEWQARIEHILKEDT